MASFCPYLVRLYWGGRFSYVNGAVQHDDCLVTTSFIMRAEMSFEDLVEAVCSHININKESVTVQLLLAFTFQGSSQTSKIFNDDGVRMMDYLAVEGRGHFVAEIYVEWQEAPPLQHISFTNLLRDVANVNVDAPLDFHIDAESIQVAAGNDQNDEVGSPMTVVPPANILSVRSEPVSPGFTLPV